MTARELPWSIRAALRLLPRAYRDHRTAELHATLGEVADSHGLDVGVEALSLVALSIRVRSASLLAPPSHHRARAASLAAVVLPVLLIVPAARAVDLGLPVIPLPSGLFWIWSALVPAWVVTAVAALLTLLGVVRWAHRFSILAVALFIAGLLALIASTNASTAVSQSVWLPFIATSAALNRDPQRVRSGRRALGTIGVTITGLIGLGAAVAYVAAGPGWWYLLPTAVQPVFNQARWVIGGVLLVACLAGLASRAVRAAIPVTAALTTAYVGANSPWSFWADTTPPIGAVTWEYPLMGVWISDMVVAPIAVFLAARALTALVDRIGASPTAESLSA